MLYASEAPEPRVARSAVLDLVQGVWEALPGQAHAALRGRIFTTAPVSEVDREVVRVAAKRLTSDVPPPARLDVDLGPHAARARERARSATLEVPDDVDWPTWLREAAPVDDVPPKVRDRPVAAALLDADGRPLLAARNASGTNRTLHAEVCLLQAFGCPLPVGARVVVGLQPCRMCAALLVHCASGPLDVRYLEPDPGRFARNTALQARGWERPLR